MRNLSRTALFLVLSLALTAPVFPQANDEKDWKSIQDQKDQKKKAEQLEAFIKKFPTSSKRPGADTDLVDIWSKSNENAKILAFAEQYKANPPSPDATAKTKIYAQAMLIAAGTPGQAGKAGEFAIAAIEADPNHFQSLYFLARAAQPPNNYEFAQKALTVPKPASISADTYNKNMAQLHGIVALPLIAQKKFQDAREHLEAVIKSDPKNQEAHYRYGFATVNLMGEAAKAANDANLAMLRAVQEQKPADVEANKVKQTTSERESLELRDAAIDSLAKALAVGGPYTDPAKQLFESLYTNKNKSLEGADKLIAEKKAELNVL